MKNNFKRILSILLILVMVFAFAGCKDGETSSDASDVAATDDFFTDTETANENSDKDSGKDTGKDSGKGSGKDSGKDSGKNTVVPKENQVGGTGWEKVLASMPKSLKGTTVVMYNWNPANEYTGAPKVISNFEKETGIKVKWMTINFGVYFTRIASLVASGDSPDVVRTRNPWPSQLANFQSLDTAKFDFSDDAWDKTTMKDYTVKGITYATSLKNTHIGSVMMVYYNKELINRYNLEDPFTLWKNGKWTTDKFLEICRDYKKQAGSSAHFGCVGFNDYGPWLEIHGLSGTYDFDGTKFTSNLGNSKFLTITQTAADLFNTEQILGYGREESFNAGNSLFYWGGSVYLRAENSYAGKIKQAGNFYAVPCPSVPGQSTYYQGKDEYEAYAIAKGAKNPQAVPYFLRYFLDGANYDLNNFFGNAQNLEAYNWAMSQTNTVFSIGMSGGEGFSGINNADGILAKPGAQIKSFLDANASLVDKAVADQNAALAKLPSK